MQALRIATAVACGAVFAVGLGIAGALKPAVIQGFLDVTGAWDPTLLVMFASALVSFALLQQVARRMTRPVLAAAFQWPSRRPVDAPLVCGSAIFGAGWALAGVCPGPALASAAWSAPIAAFTATLLVSIAVLDRIRSRRGAERGCE